jgi:hypothetical protein
MTVLIVVERPLPRANDLFLIKERGARGVTIFPDGNGARESDFPYSGISLYYSSKKHFVVACGHKERCILSHVPAGSVDLGQFSPEWKGCSLKLTRIEEEKTQTDFSLHPSDGGE